MWWSDDCFQDSRSGHLGTGKTMTSLVVWSPGVMFNIDNKESLFFVLSYVLVSTDVSPQEEFVPCFVSIIYLKCVRLLSSKLFHGSLNCLDVLLLVRPPVYRAEWALHRTGDMNAHSSSSVITFIVQTPVSSHTPFSPHHHLISLTSRAYRTGVLTQKGVFRIYGNIGVD
jgi:hypothetical protein